MNELNWMNERKEKKEKNKFKECELYFISRLSEVWKKWIKEKGENEYKKKEEK